MNKIYTQRLHKRKSWRIGENEREVRKVCFSKITFHSSTLQLNDPNYLEKLRKKSRVNLTIIYDIIDTLDIDPIYICIYNEYYEYWEYLYIKWYKIYTPLFK